MTDDYSFLTQLITEDIYVVKERELGPTTGSQTNEPTTEKGDEEGVVSESKETYIKPLQTEGNNLKHCLVFVESSSEIIDANSKEFLSNVLKAVKRSLDDILLINLKGASIKQIEALMAEQNHRHLLVFGTGKLDDLFTSEQYTVHESNHKYFLKADDLKIISEEKDKKKALWTALQKMFL